MVQLKSKVLYPPFVLVSVIMLPFLYLLLLLVAALFFGKVAERLKQPTLVGNILGGLVFGPLLILLLELFGSSTMDGIAFDLGPDRVELKLDFLMQFAIVMVMFSSGLETQIKEFIASFKVGFFTAVLGVLFPFVMGFVGAYIFLGDWLISLFVGGALSITSVAISLTTLIQMDAIRTRFGITILNAAIADDVIGILILSVLLSFARTGNLPNFFVVGGSVAVSVMFVVLAVLLLPRLSRFIFSGIRSERVTEAIGFSILVAGLIAVGAHLVGLHLMIGALLGGMAVRDSLPQDLREALNRWSFGFFAPVFFAWVGFSVTFKGMAFSLFTLVIIAMGFLGKFLGAGIGSKVSGLKWSESLLVGIGMNGRAGVELVLVAIALQMNIINRDIYSAVVYNAIVMSLITPVLLKMGYSYFRRRGSIKTLD